MKLHKLDDTEILCLQYHGEGNVIASGPWRKDGGEMANRVVLRDLGSQFVVHRQVLNVESKRVTASYCWGHYFPYYPHNIEESFGEAWVRFEEKVREHQGLPPSEKRSDRLDVE